MHDNGFYLFKLNIANFPESYNVYNSMADYYSAKGDKVNAIDGYKKALSIKEVPTFGEIRKTSKEIRKIYLTLAFYLS